MEFRIWIRKQLAVVAYCHLRPTMAQSAAVLKNCSIPTIEICKEALMSFRTTHTKQYSMPFIDSHIQ